MLVDLEQTGSKEQKGTRSDSVYNSFLTVAVIVPSTLNSIDFLA